MPAITFTLNGVDRTLTTDANRRLLWVLRDDLGLTGTKYGCGIAACGACTVLIDGKAARSCITSLQAVEGRRVTTIEGLATGEQLQPIQRAFMDHAGYQCGFCTSGMIVGAQALLDANPTPTRDQIVEGLEGHLCRCGAHVRIIAAVLAAAGAAR
ncbi:MAG TPA: (2Fe-2S)-binding protein [Gemmatimonadales bacterium]|nr:(2Fe-2S)-binding protein [Gemmatimonadales bacterium]